MTVQQDIARLRNELQGLANEFDTRLVDEYALRLPPAYRVSPYRRLRALAGSFLRRTGLRRRREHPWLAGLTHVPGAEQALPWVIWAPGIERDDLRRACNAFRDLQSTLPGRVPVLVTDVADFAYFSRLGWLVEYVPKLEAPADRFAGRKMRYLAWRYRDAPAVPASIGLQDGLQRQDLQID